MDSINGANGQLKPQKYWTGYSSQDLRASFSTSYHGISAKTNKSKVSLEKTQTITQTTNFFPDQPTFLENVYVAYEADEICILDF